MSEYDPDLPVQVSPTPLDIENIGVVGGSLIKFDILGVDAAKLCPECRHPWDQHWKVDGFCHFHIYRYERCHCTNQPEQGDTLTEK